MGATVLPKNPSGWTDLERLAGDAALYGVCGKPRVRSASPQLPRFLTRLFAELTPVEHFYLTQDESVMSRLNYLSRGCVPTYTPGNLQGYIAANNHALLEGKVRRPYLSGIEVALQKISRALVEHGLEEVEVADLRAHARATWEARKRAAGIGELYFAVSHEEPGDEGEPIVEAVPVSPAVQAQLRALFVGLGGATPAERERAELQALADAGVLFEKSTFLEEDLGGFLGNYTRTMKDGTRLTRCGSETMTFSLFIGALEAQGWLRTIGVDAQGDVIRVGTFAKHQAVRLAGKETGEKYVYDSWMEDGGKPPHVLREKDWFEGDDDASALSPP